MKRKRPSSASAARDGGPKIRKSTSHMSEAVQDRLADDDAQIALLEKKLGMKKNKKSMPNSFKEDGLADLLQDWGDEEEGEPTGENQRKTEYDEWLAQKRRGMQKGHKRRAGNEDSENFDKSASESDLGSDAVSGDWSEDGDSEDSFGGFDDDTDGEDGTEHSGTGDTKDTASPKKVRENPYVAPTTGTTAAAKYVPPSLRKGAGSEDNTALRRRLQGLLNRLTESNIQGILKDVENVYAANPRGLVTSLLVDAIMAQVSNDSALSETFFILHGGFVAGLYRIIGESFGSHIVTRLVEDFRQEYANAKESLARGSQVIPKAPSNLITLISEFYVFQIVGCNLVFDFVRLLLDELSELNTELLLRLVRTAGKLLRKDDPQALKEVAGRLQSSLAAADSKQVTERTRFMVDTITDLKNNKLRAGLQESAIATGHITTMKKFLGTLNSKRSTTAGPLRIGLKDIDEAQTKGKWWLVGASFAGRTEGPKNGEVSKEEMPEAESSSDDEDLDIFFPDYIRVAKEQGLKTDTQHAIFAALAGASDHNDAYIRFQKLSLNKNQRREVAFVLIQAAGSEQPYNPYYALVAKKMCSDGRIRFAFQDRLWYLFRRLGESVFEEEGDQEEEEEDAAELSDDRLANVGRMAGSLVASSSLSIKTLKCLDIPTVKKKTSLLLEQMMVAIFRDCRKRDKNKTGSGDGTLERTFKEALGSPVLAAGLHFYLGKLSKSVGKSKRVKKTDVDMIKDGCKRARFVLETGMTGAGDD